MFRHKIRTRHSLALMILCYAALQAPARVYDDAPAYRRSHMNLARATGAPVRTYRANWNGRPVTYEISHSPRPMQQVFDALEAQRPKRKGGSDTLPGEMRVRVGNDGLATTLPRSLDEVASLALAATPILREEGKDWGVWFDPSMAVDGDLKARVASAIRPGSLRSGARPPFASSAPVVLAFPGQGGSGTTYFSVMREPSSESTQAYGIDRDQPGTDPSDVPRPENAIRIGSFSQVHEGIRYAVYAYRLSSAANTLEHYSQSLRNLGWESTPYSNTPSGQDIGSSNVGSFNSGKRHLQVIWKRTPKATKVTLIRFEALNL